MSSTTLWARPCSSQVWSAPCTTNQTRLGLGLSWCKQTTCRGRASLPATPRVQSPRNLLEKDPRLPVCHLPSRTQETPLRHWTLTTSASDWVRTLTKRRIWSTAWQCRRDNLRTKSAVRKARARCVNCTCKTTSCSVWSARRNAALNAFRSATTWSDKDHPCTSHRHLRSSAKRLSQMIAWTN